MAMVSCSQEEANQSASATSNSSLASRTATDPAANANNPYDEVGRIHNQLFDAYFSQDTLVKSVEGISADVEAIALDDKDFPDLVGASATRNTVSRLYNLVGRESTAVSDAIGNSTLSAYAKSGLQHFCDQIVLLNSTTDEFDDMYTLIETYETQVSQDTVLTATDKKKILTVASITRYSTYKAKKKPKKNTDSDWDMMGFGLAGSIEGIENSPAEAIINALSAKILQNQ